MADVFSRAKRSRIMSRIKGKDTKPEVKVRSLLHRLGYRFRLHRKDLPGTPDIVLPRHKAVIFVHGCFWHRHEGCPRATLPANNAAFWREKLQGNVERDRRHREELRSLGWRVLSIWQCETRDEAELSRILIDFLANS
jgi:DNA mismatch endonuclease (patch repair protein)